VWSKRSFGPIRATNAGCPTSRSFFARCGIPQVSPSSLLRSPQLYTGALRSHQRTWAENDGRSPPQPFAEAHHSLSLRTPPLSSRPKRSEVQGPAVQRSGLGNVFGGAPAPPGQIGFAQPFAITSSRADQETAHRHGYQINPFTPLCAVQKPYYCGPKIQTSQSKVVPLVTELVRLVRTFLHAQRQPRGLFTHFFRNT
jgi:hypothetical protein